MRLLLIILIVFFYSCETASIGKQRNMFELFSDRYNGEFPEDKKLFEYLDQKTLKVENQNYRLEKESIGYSLEVKYSINLNDSGKSITFTISEHDESIPPGYSDFSGFF